MGQASAVMEEAYPPWVVAVMVVVMPVGVGARLPDERYTHAQSGWWPRKFRE